MHAAVRAAELERIRPDVLHIDARAHGSVLGTRPPGVHVHLDFVDALSLNMASRAGRSRFPASAAFGLEARLMARYEARAAARGGHRIGRIGARPAASPGLAPPT